MGLLAAASLQASALPPGVALPGGLAVLAHVARLAWRDWHAPAGRLAWRQGDAFAHWTDAAGTHVLANLTVRWRGPIATLEARDEAGTLRRRSWWPDTLPPPARRALRLASEPAPAPRAANQRETRAVDARTPPIAARLPT